jgi:hypothetical protein
MPCSGYPEGVDDADLILLVASVVDRGGQRFFEPGRPLVNHSTQTQRHRMRQGRRPLRSAQPFQIWIACKGW